MHKRTAHRFRLTAVLLAGVLFAFGSFWLLQAIISGDADIKSDPSLNEPDYIVEKFSVVRMAPNGQPRYIISGDKLTHRPLDDSADVDNPVVKSVSPDQAAMTINAKRAHIDHGNTRVQLMDDVRVVRAASAKSEPMVLTTEALTVLPDEERIETDQPVEMKLGSATVRGTGMWADNAKRQLHMESRGHLSQPPKARQ